MSTDAVSQVNSTGDLLTYIRGPLRKKHGLSSAAVAWVSVQMHLRQPNEKVRAWLGATGPTPRAEAALVDLRQTAAADISTAVVAEDNKAKAQAAADEVKRLRAQAAFDAWFAAMTDQERQNFMDEAQDAADFIDACEEHGSTKTLPRGWSIRGDGRTLNQFGAAV